MTFCYNLDGIAKKQTKTIKKRSEISPEALLSKGMLKTKIYI